MHHEAHAYPVGVREVISDTVIPNVSNQEIVTAFSNEIMHLILLPTEQCNFRCVYCYEDFSIGNMKPSVVAGVKRLLERRVPALRQLHIGWFGGEPLIALKVIEEISESAMSLTQDIPGIVYTSEVTTNGYRLDLATAQRLYELNIRHYQITLDGPKEFHNQTRVQRNGKGSFGIIWDNLVALRSSSLAINITLRIHVTPANLGSMPDFLARIREQFLDDHRFNALIKAVGHWGGSQDNEFEVLNPEEGARAIKMLEEQVSQDGKRDVVSRPGNVCYASRPNSLLVRASGEIGKCTVALSDPANNIGRLLEDGTLELRSEYLRPWIRGWNVSDVDILGCPLIGLPRSKGEPVLLQIGAGAGVAERNRVEAHQ